ncbi:leukotriene C4 synthase isoform X2 [Notamacropus eugenii]|uniref:leukotriene C4 synthase isoform X2 n=1 Tax=Notamacropus eugenii TaxID=9315 RepID=UPI003B66B454
MHGVHEEVALLATVTLCGVLLQAYFSWQVITARRRFRVSPPATTGPPEFERVFRAQDSSCLRPALPGGPIQILPWLCWVGPREAGPPVLRCPCPLAAGSSVCIGPDIPLSSSLPQEGPPE